MQLLFQSSRLELICTPAEDGSMAAQHVIHGSARLWEVENDECDEDRDNDAPSYEEALRISDISLTATLVFADDARWSTLCTPIPVLGRSLSDEEERAIQDLVLGTASRSPLLLWYVPDSEDQSSTREFSSIAKLRIYLRLGLGDTRRLEEWTLRAGVEPDLLPQLDASDFCFALDNRAAVARGLSTWSMFLRGFGPAVANYYALVYRGRRRSQS